MDHTKLLSADSLVPSSSSIQDQSAHSSPRKELMKPGMHGLNHGSSCAEEAFHQPLSHTSASHGDSSNMSTWDSFARDSFQNQCDVFPFQTVFCTFLPTEQYAGHLHMRICVHLGLRWSLGAEHLHSRNRALSWTSALQMKCLIKKKNVSPVLEL